MPLNDAARNAMLNNLGGLITHASLHTADPGTTGTSEVAGGTYARQSITWNAAATSNLDNLANPVFNVPAATTVTHVGFWSAVTAGTFYGSATVTSETFVGAGTYTVSDADISVS